MMLAGAVGMIMALAGPASAATPPTALQQARKLVKAGVCTDARVTNPAETVAACDDGSGFPLEVHAFRTANAMRADLTVDLADGCDLLPGGGRGSRLSYRVASTWWMAPYTGALRTRIGRALGGKLRSYDCP